MAFVMLAPALSWPLTVACLFAFVLGLIVVMQEPGGRRFVGAFVLALMLFATVGATKLDASDNVVISDEVCKAYPWLIECWCPICL